MSINSSNSSSGASTPRSGYQSARDYESQQDELSHIQDGHLEMEFLEPSASHLGLEFLPKESSKIGFYLDVGGGKSAPIHYKKERDSQKEAIDKARLIGTFLDEVEDFYDTVVLQKHPELGGFGFTSDNFVKYHLKTGLLVLAFGEGDDRKEYRFHMGEAKNKFDSINDMYLYLNAHTEVSTANMPQFSIYSKAPINAPLSILETPEKQTERLLEKVRYIYNHDIDYWDSSKHNRFSEKLYDKGRLPEKRLERLANGLDFGRRLQERLLKELNLILESAKERGDFIKKELESLEQIKSFKNRVQSLDLFAITSALALKIGNGNTTHESAKEDLVLMKEYIASLRPDGIKGVVSRIPLVRDGFDLGPQLSSIEEDYAKAIVGMTLDPLTYHDFMQGRMKQDSLEEEFFHMIMSLDPTAAFQATLSKMNKDAREVIKNILSDLDPELRDSYSPREELRRSLPDDSGSDSEEDDGPRPVHGNGRGAYLVEVSASRRGSVESSPRTSLVPNILGDASTDRISSRWPQGIGAVNIAADFEFSDNDEMDDL